jgi:molecular chaperone GrpE
LKLRKLKNALEIEKKRANDCFSRLQYMQADFENLRKRLEKQMDDVKKFSNERLIINLLEAIDELDIAASLSGSPTNSEAISQGITMTLKKLKKLLEQEEVYPIKSVGEPFDPSKHMATERIVREDVDEGKVLEEIRKGYIMKGKVIRPSLVKISTKPNTKLNVKQHER